jgi:hypothetical protein
MKKFTLLGLTAISLFTAPSEGNAQAPNLGSAGNFVVFSAQGNVSNTGLSYYTGNIGTNGGASNGFGNVNGQMADGTPQAIQCAIDVQSAYNQLDAATPNSFPSVNLGNGATLNAGVHSINNSANLNQTLILDGQGNPNSIFIFQIDGSLISTANANIVTINGAHSCNVFWKVEGFILLAPGTSMKGTMIANNADINLSAGDTLDGRIFSTGGLITLNEVFAFTPLGCGTPTLSGPTAPNLATSKCFALFSSNGSISNTGVTNVTGDVGGNSGPTTGFDSSLVNGVLHYLPNPSTVSCATDLANVYAYLNGLSYDIELLYPNQLGMGLMLTPHTYLINGATTLSDTLVLDAMGNGNAIFVIRIIGNFTALPNASIKLINGALSGNVYWQVEGAMTVSTGSYLRGTIIANNSVTSNLQQGSIIDGRVMTTNGSIATNAMLIVAPNIPLNCPETVGIAEKKGNAGISIFPNPSKGFLTLTLSEEESKLGLDISFYNTLGMKVLSSTLNKSITVLDITALSKGVYYYTLSESNRILQKGKVVVD